MDCSGRRRSGKEEVEEEAIVEGGAGHDVSREKGRSRRRLDAKKRKERKMYCSGKGRVARRRLNRSEKWKDEWDIEGKKEKTQNTTWSRRRLDAKKRKERKVDCSGKRRSGKEEVEQE